MSEHYEVVRTVNGYDIVRAKGTHGCYYVTIRKGKTWSQFAVFKTIKSAVAFCETL